MEHNNYSANMPSTYLGKIKFFWKNLSSFIKAEFSKDPITSEQIKTYSIFMLFGGDKDHFELSRKLLDTRRKLETLDQSDLSISDLMEPYLTYNKPIEFKHDSITKMLGIGIVICAPIILVTLALTETLAGIPLSIPILVPMVFLAYVCYRNHCLINDVSNGIIKLDRIKDNGLKIQNELKTPLYKWLNSHLDGFNRGKEGNKLSKVYTGLKKIKQVQLEYLAFEYESIVSKHKDSKGVARCTIDTYQGILLPCSGLKKITISPDKKVKSDLNKWTTPSLNFNKDYNIWAEQELDAAKLLTPATILHIESANESLGGLHLLFSSEGDICLLFKSKINNLEQDPSQPHSLKNPKEFLASLKEDHFCQTHSNSLEFLLYIFEKANAEQSKSLNDFINSLLIVKKMNKPGVLGDFKGSNSLESAFLAISKTLEVINENKNRK